MSLKKTCNCCSFTFPHIPTQWLLFIEFAFTFGTTIVYFADIVTDILTLYAYFRNQWYYAFGLSIFFIVVPSILLAILEYNFLTKTFKKSKTSKNIILKTILNIPFQLTVVWYHCELSYDCLKNWLNHIRGVQEKSTKSTAQWYNPTTLERSRGASLSSLNELDLYEEISNDQDNRNVILNSNLSGSNGLLDDVGDNKDNDKKFSWWKRLTKEQWLSHLNKLKLYESMLESLPQLLINLFVIIWYKNAATIQYISAVLSYLSLCGGVVRYDKTKKDNEADRWMADPTLLHSRVFYTRLEWAQLLFISIYKACFLAARSLAFVYFTIYFFWYVLIPLFLHWSILLGYLIYRWYPDFSKVTRQLRQADNKYRAYTFLSKDFMSVLLESLIGIFIYVRPYCLAFIDQPYCFMFLYYVAYVSENLILFLLPGIIKAFGSNYESLELFQYYPLLFVEIVLNVVGSLVCATYYLAVHKSRAYTAHAYPMASRALCCLCYSNQSADDFGYWLPINDEYTVCKQVETSELFFLTKDQLKLFRQTYNTVARRDKRKGRSIECFIDDRCRIFYAPRSKLIKLNLNASVDDVRSRDARIEIRPLKSNEESSITVDSERRNNDSTVDVDVRSPSYHPVRKPRVKSLRTYKPESPRDPPVPLPRKSLSSTPIENLKTPDSSSVNDVSCPKLPEAPPISHKVASSDASVNRPVDIDSSTYRVKKPSKASARPKIPSNTNNDEKLQSHNSEPNKSRRVKKEWKQTWL